MGLLSADGAVLRVWVLITGLAGLGAGISAYRKPLSPHKTLYNNTSATKNEAFAHMYGTWLFTSTIIRVSFFLAAAPLRQPSSPLFWITLGTYLIALFHFVTEIFVYRHASLLPGGFAPLVVAGLSILWFVVIVITT